MDAILKKRLLIVDDNPVNLKLAGDLMESEGYFVDRADSAESALTSIAKRIPDLILMDLALPGMDGLTLTRKLKSEEATRRVPVVALSAYAMKSDEQKALEAGCDAFVAKPMDTRTLPSRLAALLAAAG